MDELRKILTHNAGRLPERLEQDVAAITKLIEGVIGEDEEPLTGKDVVFFALKHSIDGRNALRAMAAILAAHNAAIAQARREFAERLIGRVHSDDLKFAAGVQALEGVILAALEGEQANKD